MTPEEYLARLDALMASGRHGEALAFSAAEASRIAPPLTVEQRESLYGLMEIAATLLGRNADAIVRQWACVRRT